MTTSTTRLFTFIHPPSILGQSATLAHLFFRHVKPTVLRPPHAHMSMLTFNPRSHTRQEREKKSIKARDTWYQSAAHLKGEKPLYPRLLRKEAHKTKQKSKCRNSSALRYQVQQTRGISDRHSTPSAQSFPQSQKNPRPVSSE